MLALFLAVLPFVQAIDATTGRSLPVPVHVERSPDVAHAFEVEVDGSALHYATFHGWFREGAIPSRIRLTALSADDERGLERVNAFRARYGLEPLVVDENLTEAARYWAREELAAQHVGHTCATIGAPPQCVEFNAYYHRLPGVPSNWDAGQNAAFDTLATWLAPEALFEAERNTKDGERGHFLNLIGAQRWIGLGEASIPGYGAYFAMNLM